MESRPLRARAQDVRLPGLQVRARANAVCMSHACECGCVRSPRVVDVATVRGLRLGAAKGGWSALTRWVAVGYLMRWREFTVKGCRRWR